MKRFVAKLLILCISIGLCIGELAGCGTDKEVSTTKEQEITEEQVEEAEEQTVSFSLPDSLEEADIYIEPIPDISENFIRVIDPSNVI